MMAIRERTGAQVLETGAPAQTMEDILSSIRKIINEEATPHTNMEEDDDILELTQEVREDGSIVPISLSQTVRAPTPIAPQIPERLKMGFEDAECDEPFYLKEARKMYTPSALNTLFQREPSLAGMTQQEDTLIMPRNTPLKESKRLVEPQTQKKGMGEDMRFLSALFQEETASTIGAYITQQEDTPIMAQNKTLEESKKPVEPNAQKGPKDLDHLEEMLVSRATADASVATLASLSRRLNRRKEPVGEQTVDQLMRSILKPLISEWLDAHLPQVVERIVAHEVSLIVQAAEHEQL